MRSQRLDTERELLRFHCFETLEGDDIVLVHGQKMSTDARTKTDRTTNDENVHGDTEKRAECCISDKQYGAGKMRAAEKILSTS